MQTLREWRTRAQERGFTRIAELADYLQADELTHVKLATKWIRRLVEDDPEHRDELVRWGRKAVDHIEGFYADNAYGRATEPDVHFTFQPGGGEIVSGRRSRVIGE
jgi:hypothetical protein